MGTSNSITYQVRTCKLFIGKIPAEGEDLPHSDSKHPHIWYFREFTIEILGSHSLKRENGMSVQFVVARGKIGNLDSTVDSNEAAPRC